MAYQHPSQAQAAYLRQPLYEQPYSEEYAGGYAPSAPPLPSPPPAAPSGGGGASKFSAHGYRDVAWALLFVLHLVAYLGGGGYVLSKYSNELTVATTNSTQSPSFSASPAFIVNPRLYSSTFDSTATVSQSTANGTMVTTEDDHIRLQRDVILIGLSSLGVSALVALLWLSLAKSNARAMIYAALTADVGVSLVMVVVCLMYGALLGVLLFGLFAGLKMLWVYWVRSRIEFAAVILTHSIHCIQQWPATIGVAFLSLVLQAAWVVGWGFSSVGFYYAVTRVAGAGAAASNAKGNDGQMQEDSGASYVVLFLMLLSFYWTSQVIKNTLHVTVSGVAAVWYFLYPQGDYSSPTWSSFRRAATTSFGSVALGSLVLSIVRALRVTVNIMASQPANARGGAAAVRAVFYCMAQCLLSILDRVVMYVNKYAFAYVAIYGKTYCDAAKAVWELFQARGFDAVLNDVSISLTHRATTRSAALHALTSPTCAVCCAQSLIGIALGFACLMGGLTSAAVCGVLSHSVFTEGGSWIVWAIIGGVLGFAMTMIATEVVESAVVSLFVCLADDPAALQRTKPEEYAKLVPAIQARYPAVSFVPVMF